MDVEIEPPANEAIRNVSSSDVSFGMHKISASKKSQQRTFTYWDILHLEIQRA